MTANNFSPRAFRRSLRGAGITATEYRVAVELCEHAGPDKPVVWPSIGLLAEDCEISERSVVRVLNQLEADGFIVCDGGRKGGRGQSTRWRLIIKGDTSDTLSDTERVSRETKRVSNLAVKGDTGVTRSSKEEERRGKRVALADARDTLPTPPPISETEPTTQRLGNPATPTPLNNEDAYHPTTWAEWVAEWADPGLPIDKPNRFCDKHPTGTSDPCGRCGHQREVHTRWESEHQEWRESRQEARKDIRDCRTCDDAGLLYHLNGHDTYWCEHGLDKPLNYRPAAAEQIRGCALCDHNGLLVDPTNGRAYWCDHAATLPPGLQHLKPCHPAPAAGPPTAHPNNRSLTSENTMEGKHCDRS